MQPSKTRSAETELQSTIELRATASEFVASKPDLDARAKKRRFWSIFKRIFRRKITSAKMEKKTHFVRDFLQNSIDNSSTSTTCNPIYIAWTILQLQITMEFCRPHMHEKHLKPHLQCGTDPRMIRPWSENDPTTHETVSHPSHRRGRSSTFGDGLCMEKHRVSCICYLSKTHFVRDFLQNSIGNSSTSTTCNPIYIAGTILQLQITMEFCRPHMHEKHLKPHLQCGTDPRMIREWSDHDPRMIRPHTRPSRTRRTAEVDHRRSGTDFVWKNTGFRASAISQKRISCETSFKTPSATHPPAPLAIPFTLRERSYSCKSQWNSVDRTCTKNTWNPIYNAEPIREWSDHAPRMIRPHTRPSRTRRTAEVDHRRSGMDFVWKNTGFRASAISQKRISCETSFKTPSATHPPAPLAIPFTLRERSYSCKSQWNSVDRTCTKNTWNPIYNAEPIREWSDHDPRMIRPHTRPSRTRRTAEVDHRRSGTDFVWKNTGFRASALSKTHFVRDFLQNSIGNSSTSTTCNPIYIAGTISLTNSFPNELFLC